MNKILLKNAAVHDALNWGMLTDILVEGDEITEMGAGLSGDIEIDMKGAAVLPGFFDAHVHLVSGDEKLSDEALRQWAYNGVTTVRDMGFGGKQSLEEYMRWVKEASASENMSKCLTAGRFVTALHGYGHIMGGHENGVPAGTPDEARAAVRKLHSLGASGIKTAADREPGRADTPVLSTETFSAIADECEKLGIWCAAHVLSADFLPSLVEAGIAEMAHVPLDHISDELLDEMVKKDISVTPTLQPINAPRPPLPPGELPPEMKKIIEAMSKIDTAEQERIALDNVRRFFEKGGRVAFGTDTMRMQGSPEVPGIPIKELQLLHKAGLSVKDAVTAATLNSARVCKMDKTHGSIITGKKADIIAVGTKIDETFEAFSSITFVMNKGVIIRQEL